jgi:hypothetical protein
VGLHCLGPLAPCCCDLAAVGMSYRVCGLCCSEGVLLVIRMMQSGGVCCLGHCGFGRRDKCVRVGACGMLYGTVFIGRMYCVRDGRYTPGTALNDLTCRLLFLPDIDCWLVVQGQCYGCKLSRQILCWCNRVHTYYLYI